MTRERLINSPRWVRQLAIVVLMVISLAIFMPFIEVFQAGIEAGDVQLILKAGVIGLPIPFLSMLQGILIGSLNMKPEDLKKPMSKKRKGNR